MVNSGTQNALTFIDDEFPAGLGECRLVSELADVSCEGGRRLRGFVNVPANGRVEVVFRGTVAAEANNGTVIQNRVVLTAGNQRVERLSDALTVQAGPDLSRLTKSAIGVVDGVAVPGQTFTYRISVTNSGNQAARNVRIVDPLPTRFAAVNPADGGRFDAIANTVSWDIAELAPGAAAVVSFEVTLSDAVANGTEISNQAEVSVDGARILSDDPSTDVSDDPTRVVVRSQPLLVVTQRASLIFAQPRDTIVYDIVIRNEGTDAAERVRVDGQLPNALFRSIVAVNGAVDNGALNWTFETVPALARIEVGQSVALRARGRLNSVVDNGTRIESQMRVNAGFGDVLSDDPRTAEVNDPTVVTIRSTPIYALSKTVNDLNGGSPQAGDRVRYTLTLVNEGNSAGTNVIVRDPCRPGSWMLSYSMAVKLWARKYRGPAATALRSMQTPSLTGLRRRFDVTC